MNMTSIGDLANSLMIRRQSVELKQEISVLTQELSTGQVADVSSRLGGDVSVLADIERNLTRLDSYSIAAKEAAISAETAQASLGQIASVGSQLGETLIGLELSNSDGSATHLGLQAEQGIASVISALNTSVAGRSLFSGVATDQAPLASADQLMSAIRAEVSGLTTADDIMAAVEGWFSNATGFDATMYQGSDQQLSPVTIGEDESVSFTLTANDPVFRDTLREMAVVALAGDESLGFGTETREALLERAAGGLMQESANIAQAQADLGFTQSRIEDATARNAAAKYGYESTRNDLLEADPLDTATRLEDAQFRLETLYTVTVRSSNLSLLNFLS